MLDQQRYQREQGLGDAVRRHPPRRAPSGLRKDPSDFEALVRGITVYMVVIEGTLALTGARFIISR